jgi:octaprenyl-diphosphate synthase
VSLDPVAVPDVRSGLRSILGLVEDDLQQVEFLFEGQMESDVGLVGEIARYVREGGGKRIRPALLLLSSRLCGYRGERAVLLGGVVEFIHSATLLHDDIIDEAKTRRGRSSVNGRWGNDITVLLGDFLYTKSMSMALSQDNLPILRLLSEVTLRMIEGELLQIETRGTIGTTPEMHLDITRRKTADLIALCARIGAILGGAVPEKERALDQYGRKLGICFQMVDDLLDFTADESVLGKPVLNDLREGRLTLPSIFLMRREGARGRTLVEQALAKGGFSRGRAEGVLAAVRASGALAEAQQLAEDYAAAARAELRVFEPSPFRDALEALPGFVLARDH